LAPRAAVTRAALPQAARAAAAPASSAAARLAPMAQAPKPPQQSEVRADAEVLGVRSAQARDALAVPVAAQRLPAEQARRTTETASRR
jgi:hypothetical protein